ncbi:MAG: SRPBCC family protein [Chloroflexi bacterium]|nr:SRPBCC family protein [Chloroflexota bacterium]
MIQTIIGITIAGTLFVAAYLFLIKPRHLRWGATDAEVVRAMPGDDEIKNPMFTFTRAITIHAPSADVWPWLVQMGFERGGMYAYDWVDRFMGILDKTSTHRIIPELQHLKVGDIIPMGSGPSWPVKAIEPYHSLLLGADESDVEFTWSYLLDALDEEQTRLVLRVRLRLRQAITFQSIPLFIIMDPGEFLMTRQHLRGIKQRAEGLFAQREQQEIALAVRSCKSTS